MIQSILNTVQQFIAKIHYMQRAYILCMLNLLFLENVQLKQLIQAKDQSVSTSDRKCKFSYFVLK